MQVEDTKLISESSDKTEELEIEIMIEPVEGQDIRYKTTINIFWKTTCISSCHSNFISLFVYF